MSTRPTYFAIAIQLHSQKWQVYVNLIGSFTAIGSECDTAHEAAVSAAAEWRLTTLNKSRLYVTNLPDEEFHT